MSSISKSNLPHDQRCVALLYHHVGQAKAGAYPDLSISPKEFERQIHWLADHGYSGVRASELTEWLRTGSALPKKPIVITFDDAYADIAEHALPILRDYGFGALIFVVSARIGVTSDWDAEFGYTTLPLMSAEQIRYWATQGFEFGSHSRSHLDLTKISPEALRDEVVTSRDELSGLLECPVTTFAYPFGAYNCAVQMQVRSSFEIAFSADEGCNSRQTAPHLLKRIIVKPNQSMLAFSLMIRLGESWRSKLALRTRMKRAFGIR